MDRGAWWAAVHGVAKSRTRLSDFTITFHFHALEKEMATHSSVRVWRIPGTGEPGGLLCSGPHRVGNDWSDLAAAAAAAAAQHNLGSVLNNILLEWLMLNNEDEAHCHWILTTSLWGRWRWQSAHTARQVLLREARWFVQCHVGQ